MAVKMLESVMMSSGSVPENNLAVTEQEKQGFSVEGEERKVYGKEKQ